MIESLQDIIDSYDDLRYKNQILFGIRKNGLYEEYPKLKELDYKLIDLYADFSISREEKNKKIELLKQEKKEFLKLNSIDPSYDEMIYNCPKCKDTGYVEGKKCDCFVEKEMKLFYRETNFNEIKNNFSFDKVDYNAYKQDIQGFENSDYYTYMKNVIRLLKEQIDNINKKPVNVLIVGPTGTGKTFLVKCMSSYVYDKKMTCMFLKITDYFDYIRKTDHNNNEKYDVEEFADYVDFLVIDDLGKEYVTDYAISKIQVLIENRLEKNKSTVIATHYDKTELAKIYGESLASRIHNQYLTYNLYGRDLRSKYNE